MAPVGRAWYGHHVTPNETLAERVRRFFALLGERYDRLASAKPPNSCCITGVALEMEAKAEAERRAKQATG